MMLTSSSTLPIKRIKLKASQSLIIGVRNSSCHRRLRQDDLSAYHLRSNSDTLQKEPESEGDRLWMNKLPRTELEPKYHLSATRDETYGFVLSASKRNKFMNFPKSVSSPDRILPADRFSFPENPRRMMARKLSLAIDIPPIIKDPNPFPSSVQNCQKQRQFHSYHAKYGQGEDVSIRETNSPIVRQAYIALGSNVGNRVQNIELAGNNMTERGITVEKTSALYETQPMYYEDQELFLNCVCQVKTSLSPLALLDQLKEIEVELGREETIRNGPRRIDLDIILYHGMTFESDKLSIPHQKMMEREFVLRPLCDLIPEQSHPVYQSSFGEQLKRLEKSSAPLSAITPICTTLPPLESLKPTRSTNLMTIINMTPDSFSDGGLSYQKAPKDIIAILKKDLDLNRGTPIIDVGGQSTRPHATEVPEEEELSRVLPTIQAIRSDPFFTNVAISVDTYRASVATAAVEAGANIVNDISAGQMDPDMLPTIARLGCTCILMHMRGNPQTMTSLTSYPQGIIEDVAQELHTQVQKAEKAGIRRWRICLDPGIGFAKTQEQNLEILRRFDELKNFPSLRGFPWVVGVSRKGFIGRITGVKNADEREFGTAAAVTAAVRGGADVVRVHDTVKMGQVVKMADAIWRGSSSNGGSGMTST